MRSHSIYNRLEAYVQNVAKSRRSNYWHMRELPKEVRKAKRKGEIVLGYYDSEYSTEPYKIKYEGRRLNILTSGAAAGCGKSTNLCTYFLDFLNNLGLHKLMIDPQHEFWYRRNPNARDLSKLLKMGLNPRGHKDLVRVTPTCMNEGDTEYEYMLDTKDMTREDILTLLNLDERRQGDLNMVNRLDYALYGQNFGDYLKVMKKEIPTVNVILDRLMQGSKEVSLQNQFKTLCMRGALGVGNNVDIISLMAEKTVLFQTSTGEENYNILASYVGKILRSIIAEKRATVDKGFATRLKNPVFIYFGEFNVYYPRNRFSSSKRQLSYIYDYFRKRGISIWADCPDFMSIESKAIRQSDIVLTYKPTGGNMTVLKNEFKLSPMQIEQLGRLEFDKSHTPPAQFGVLKQSMSPEDPIPCIYPIPPLSNIHRE